MMQDLGSLAGRGPWPLGGLALSLLWGLSFACNVRGAGPERSSGFERDVWPILATHCVSCHGADSPKAGLDLRTVSGMLRGGESGPAVDPSEPEASPLLERIAQGEMPPGKARKLSPREVAV